MKTNDALFKATIPGRPYIKKNGAKVYRTGQTRRLIYSRNYIQWETLAKTKIALAKKDCATPLPLKGPLNLKAVFYFENHSGEPDLSACYEGLQDVLQKMGIIENDKQIYGHNGSTKVFGKEPRVEFELTIFNQHQKGA